MSSEEKLANDITHAMIGQMPNDMRYRLATGKMKLLFSLLEREVRMHFCKSVS